MQYLLLFTYRPGEGPEEGTPDFDAEMKRWNALMAELREDGAYVGAAGLKPDAATTVRSQGGEVTLTDGPYAETKEVLFSFMIVDVADLDAATSWAARMPAAEYGSVEVHPMEQFET